MENEKVNADAEVCENANAVSISDAIRKTANVVRKGMILRGILFLLFGLFMLNHPASTMLVITIVVGIFIAADGFGALFAAIRYDGAGKSAAIAGAVLFILFGLFTCFSPLMMNVVWVVMIGIWQLISGIQCLCAGRYLPGTAIFSGVLSILTGVVLIASPMFGLLAISWLIGLMLFISGICAIVTGIRLRTIEKSC